MGKGKVENLIQYNGQTPEIARTNGRKGGLASGVSKQRRKLIREALGEVLALEVADQELHDALVEAGLTPTYEMGMALSVMKRAAKGDVEAARFVRDTRGERPVEGITITPLLDQPAASWDMSKLTDEELMALAARYDEEEPQSLPPAQ